jgi:hypothetical protein
MKNSDVARRLGEIQRLFSETAGSVPAFDAKSAAVPFGIVSGIPQPVESFSTAMSEIRSALGQAARTFGATGSYPSASGSGTASGVREEIRADIRGLANLALGLTPPSAAILEIIGELEQGAQATTPPSDGGPVPYPPLRVAASVIAQADELLPMAAAARGRELFGRVLGEISDRATQWLGAIGAALEPPAKTPSKKEMAALNTAIFELYLATARGTREAADFVQSYPRLATSGAGAWKQALSHVVEEVQPWIRWWWACPLPPGSASAPPAPLLAPKTPSPRLFADPLLAALSSWLPTPASLASEAPPNPPQRTAQAIETALQTLRDLLG